LGSEGLKRVMLGVWNEVLVGFKHVRAIAHRWQVLDLLPEDLTSFDRPSFKGKAEYLAKDEFHRSAEPTLRSFLG
jgi:hypothetical protein